MDKIKLVYSDCLDFLKEIPDKSIDLILIDPPYIISKKSNFDKGGSWNNVLDKKCRKTPPKTDFGEWDKKELDLDILAKEYYRVLKPHGTLICFYDMWKIQELKETLEENKFKQFRLCRWDKTNPVPVNSKLNYLSNASEYFLTCVKEGKPTFNSSYDKGIYVYPICGGKERTSHPTQKPLSLIQELIQKHTKEGDHVLDCFLESGTTPLACQRLSRRFSGCDSSPEYIALTLSRLTNKVKEG